MPIVLGAFVYRGTRPGGIQSGFTRYRPIDTQTWFISGQRTIVVEDFFAPSTDAYLGLLRFLLGLDLVDRVLFWMLPVDDPLPGLLLDRRAAKVTAVYDETWLRVVDVHKALAARRYAGDGSVTIAVNDSLLHNNSASFAIASDGAEPTNRRAQLHIGVAGLATVLLGGATWRSLAIAGLVHADDPAALVVADRLFAVHDAPYAGFFFYALDSRAITPVMPQLLCGNCVDNAQPGQSAPQRIAWRVTSTIRAAPAPSFASLWARRALPVTASNVSQSSV